MVYTFGTIKFGKLSSSPTYLPSPLTTPSRGGGGSTPTPAEQEKRMSIANPIIRNLPPSPLTTPSRTTPSRTTPSRTTPSRTTKDEQRLQMSLIPELRKETFYDKSYETITGKDTLQEQQRQEEINRIQLETKFGLSQAKDIISEKEKEKKLAEEIRNYQSYIISEQKKQEQKQEQLDLYLSKYSGGIKEGDVERIKKDVKGLGYDVQVSGENLQFNYLNQGKSYDIFGKASALGFGMQTLPSGETQFIRDYRPSKETQDIFTQYESTTAKLKDIGTQRNKPKGLLEDVGRGVFDIVLLPKRIYDVEKQSFNVRKEISKQGFKESLLYDISPAPIKEIRIRQRLTPEERSFRTSTQIETVVTTAFGVAGVGAFGGVVSKSITPIFLGLTGAQSGYQLAKGDTRGAVVTGGTGLATLGLFKVGELGIKGGITSIGNIKLGGEKSIIIEEGKGKRTQRVFFRQITKLPQLKYRNLELLSKGKTSTIKTFEIKKEKGLDIFNLKLKDFQGIKSTKEIKVKAGTTESQTIKELLITTPLEKRLLFERVTSGKSKQLNFAIKEDLFKTQTGFYGKITEKRLIGNKIKTTSRFEDILENYGKVGEKELKQTLIIGKDYPFVIEKGLYDIGKSDKELLAYRKISQPETTKFYKSIKTMETYKDPFKFLFEKDKKPIKRRLPKIIYRPSQKDYFITEPLSATFQTFQGIKFERPKLEISKQKFTEGIIETPIETPKLKLKEVLTEFKPSKIGFTPMVLNKQLQRTSLITRQITRQIQPQIFKQSQITRQIQRQITRQIQLPFPLFTPLYTPKSPRVPPFGGGFFFPDVTGGGGGTTGSGKPSKEVVGYIPSLVSVEFGIFASGKESKELTRKGRIFGGLGVRPLIWGGR